MFSSPQRQKGIKGSFRPLDSHGNYHLALPIQRNESVKWTNENSKCLWQLNDFLIRHHTQHVRGFRQFHLHARKCVERRMNKQQGWTNVITMINVGSLNLFRFGVCMKGSRFIDYTVVLVRPKIGTLLSTGLFARSLTRLICLLSALCLLPSRAAPRWRAYSLAHSLTWSRVHGIGKLGMPDKCTQFERIHKTATNGREYNLCFLFAPKIHSWKMGKIW